MFAWARDLHYAFPSYCVIHLICSNYTSMPMPDCSSNYSYSVVLLTMEFDFNQVNPKIISYDIYSLAQYYIIKYIFMVLKRASSQLN